MNFMNRIYSIIKVANSINWKKLKDCEGYVNYDIVERLIALTNTNKGTRKENYWKLDNQIVVQSGLSEVAVYVINSNMSWCIFISLENDVEFARTM